MGAVAVGCGPGVVALIQARISIQTGSITATGKVAGNVDASIYS